MAWYHHIGRRRPVTKTEATWGAPVCVEALLGVSARWSAAVCREAPRVRSYAHGGAYTCVSGEVRLTAYAHGGAYTCVQEPLPEEEGLFEIQFNALFE